MISIVLFITKAVIIGYPFQWSNIWLDPPNIINNALIQQIVHNNNQLILHKPGGETSGQGRIW